MFGALASGLGAVGSWIGSNWQPLLSAGTSVLGSLFGMASSSDMAHEQRKTMREYMKRQAEENAIARQWSEDMSNTAHQREVADLKAAGLNPVLSATGGNGSVTPATSSHILGATDSSAGIAHEGRMKAIDTMVGLADKLSQLNLNSAMAKKATTDALNTTAQTESNIALNNAKILSEKSKAGLDQAKTGRESVRSGMYGLLSGVAAKFGIDLGGVNPSGDVNPSASSRNSAETSPLDGSLPPIDQRFITHRGFWRDLWDSSKGLLGDNPTSYPAPKIIPNISGKRTFMDSYVVPDNMMNRNDPEWRKFIGSRVFWDPKGQFWYYPRPRGNRMSYDNFKTYWAKDQLGHWRQWNPETNRPFHKIKGYKK